MTTFKGPEAMIPTRLLPVLVLQSQVEWWTHASEDYFGPAESPEEAIQLARETIPDDDLDLWDVEVGVFTDCAVYAIHHKALLDAGVPAQVAAQLVGDLRNLSDAAIWEKGRRFDDSFYPGFTPIYEVLDDWALALIHPRDVPLIPVRAGGDL